MGISCQQNGHWAVTNHLSGRGLVQPIKQSAAGQCAGRGCALIRQLANGHIPPLEKIWWQWMNLLRDERAAALFSPV